MSNPNIKDQGKETRFKPGQSGNPKGRPKGSKNQTSIVRQLLEDVRLPDKLLENKPAYFEYLPKKNFLSIITMTMISKATKGSERSADWLLKASGIDKEVKYNEVEVIVEREMYVLDMSTKKPVDDKEKATRSAVEELYRSQHGGKSYSELQQERPGPSISKNVQEQDLSRVPRRKKPRPPSDH